jgi:murein DD-endopeptidase MepM/ murein hydrolase activator NlpD
MVPPMASARNREAVRQRAPGPSRRNELERVRARRRRPERHATRFLVTAFLSAVLLLTLLLTAFGTWSSNPVATQPLASADVLPGGQPLPQIVATTGALQIQLPVSQSAVTALGYYRAGPGSIPLDPVGRQGNAGVFGRLWHRLAGSNERLVWYQLRGNGGPGTSGLAIGAAPGTDVYSPVDGTVVGITDFVLSNRTYGARIDIRPQAAPSVVVSLTHLRADPALTVGSAVAKTTKVGVVVDLTAVERQALARFTQDAGNNVSLSVRPAAVLSVR